MMGTWTKVTKTAVTIIMIFVIIGIVALLLVSFFSDVQRNVSTNHFLASYYGLFLLFRLVIYGVVSYFAYKAEKLLKQKNPQSLRPFLMMYVVTVGFVLLMEVSLWVRLLG